MGCLDARARDILMARFSTEKGEEETLKEIGERHSVSRERIRQVQEQALAKLRRVARLRVLGGAVPAQVTDDALEAEERLDADGDVVSSPDVPIAPVEPGVAVPPVPHRLRAIRLADGRSWYDIVVPIAAEHGVDVEDVVGRSRFKPNVRARAHVWWWLAKASGAAYPIEFIARAWGFGLATVMTWITRHEGRMTRLAQSKAPPPRSQPRPTGPRASSPVDVLAY